MGPSSGVISVLPLNGLLLFNGSPASPPSPPCASTKTLMCGEFTVTVKGFGVVFIESKAYTRRYRTEVVAKTCDICERIALTDHLVCLSAIIEALG